MAKRLITAVLGASLAAALSAAGAGAAEPAAASDAFADAIEKLTTQRDAAVDQVVRPLETASDVVEAPPAAGGEEPPAEEDCLGGEDPAVEALRTELRKAAKAVVNSDAGIAELDAALTTNADAYFGMLEHATTAAQISDAFDAFATAIESWDAGVSARIAELKPEYAEIVAAFLSGLEEAGACDRVIERATERLGDGQVFVDRNIALNHEAAAVFLEFAELARDATLDQLDDEPGPAPRPDEELPPPPAAAGPSLPDTGTSAAPMLLGALALITGGSTALIVARRRRVAE